jgi:hypothetical protein
LYLRQVPNVYIEGDTKIDGETTLNGGLTVVGPADLEELTVQDTTTLNDLTAADGTFTGDVTAKENLSVFGLLGVKNAEVACGSILDCNIPLVAVAIIRLFVTRSMLRSSRREGLQIRSNFRKQSFLWLLKSGTPFLFPALHSLQVEFGDKAMAKSNHAGLLCTVGVFDKY